MNPLVIPVGRSLGFALDEAKKPTKIVWPHPKYAHDLQGFCWDILGLELWSKQREMAHSFDTQDFTAVCSAHKLGKTALVAAHALRCFCSYPDTVFIALAPRLEQIAGGFWKDLGRWWRQSGICVACRRAGVTEKPCPHSTPVDGKWSDLPETGLRAGVREIYGMAATNAARMAAPSGRVYTYVDEAAGVADERFEALDGIQAGHMGRILTFNPTHRSGYAYDAFHKNAAAWTLHKISAFDSPYVTGEASPEDIAAKRFGMLATKEYIEHSKLTMSPNTYAIRVLGEFVVAAPGEMVASEDVENAHNRWTGSRVDPLHDVCIGVDIAGGIGGDLWVFAVSNGSSVLEIVKHEDVDAAGALNVLDALIARFPSAQPHRVQYDSLGRFGTQYARQLVQYQQKFPGRIVAKGLSGNAAGPRGYHRLRDALMANVAHRLKNDLALPPDEDFDEECLQLTTDTKFIDRSGLFRVEDKHRIRERIKRSPDTLDAVAYSIWDPKSAYNVVQISVAPPTVAHVAQQRPAEQDLLARAQRFAQPNQSAVFKKGIW